jgi:hypothetical protein
MAQRRFVPAGEHRGHPALLVGRARRPYGVDAAGQPPESAGGDAVLNRFFRESAPDQLPARNHLVLRPRQSAYFTPVLN